MREPFTETQTLQTLLLLLIFQFALCSEGAQRSHNQYFRKWGWNHKLATLFSANSDGQRGIKLVYVCNAVVTSARNSAKVIVVALTLPWSPAYKRCKHHISSGKQESPRKNWSRQPRLDQQIIHRNSTLEQTTMSEDSDQSYDLKGGGKSLSHKESVIHSRIRCSGQLPNWLIGSVWSLSLPQHHFHVFEEAGWCLI